MCWKKEEKELEEQKEEIYTRWKIQWEKDIKNLDGLKVFTQLFEKNYVYVKYKIKSNKRKNFLFKKLFLSLLALFPLGYIIFSLWNVLSGKTSVNTIVAVGNCFIVLLTIVLCNWVAKLLDIKKYQETWARHSQHKFKIDMEMLLYVCKMKPYNLKEKEVNVKTFTERVTEIWNGNHKKFVKNMETKEVPIMQGFNPLEAKKESK